MTTLFTGRGLSGLGRYWASVGLASVFSVFAGVSPVAGAVLGNAVVPRQFTDTDLGVVMVYTGGLAPFPAAGVAQSFSVYSTRVGVVTPLLFEITPSRGYIVRGVGTSRITSGVGAETFSYNVIAGISEVAAGNYTFGFTNRAYSVVGGVLTAGASSAGVVPFDHSGDEWPTTSNVSSGVNFTLELGTTLGPGGEAFYVGPSGGRVYSAQMTTVAVPEPAGMAAATLGLAGTGLARRRRSIGLD